ncbi:MAG: hypothetical protein HC802_19500 [Caldilineaceae bacterium]|nr:hypothetical protein [Caldilineaceae bacterium]
MAAVAISALGILGVIGGLFYAAALGSRRHLALDYVLWTPRILSILTASLALFSVSLASGSAGDPLTLEPAIASVWLGVGALFCLLAVVCLVAGLQLGWDEAIDGRQPDQMWSQSRPSAKSLFAALLMVANFALFGWWVVSRLGPN